jgi:hypothetical protein
MMPETVVLTLLTVTTGIAVVASRKKKGESAKYFCVGAILSWVLLFFYLFFLPETIIIPTPGPITAEGMQGLLIILITMFEIAGFYYLVKE